MNIIFLGTSASEGYPNAFCHCDNCERARQLGGANLRKRSSVLIDEVLLIDLGPDLMAAAQQHDVSLATMRYCLQTHEHEDHLDPSHFGSRSEWCGVYGVPELHWYASLGAVEKASRHFGHRLPVDGLLHPEAEERLNLVVHPVKPFQQFNVGPYQVTSVEANHAGDLEAMLFVIQREGRTLFYASDTGVLPRETWTYLAEKGFRFDAVIMDHTFGLTERGGGHLNSQQFVSELQRMERENLLTNESRILATHLGHHSNPDHLSLVDYAHKNDYDVAYDGLELNL